WIWIIVVLVVACCIFGLLKLFHKPKFGKVRATRRSADFNGGGQNYANMNLKGGDEMEPLRAPPSPEPRGRDFQMPTIHAETQLAAPEMHF
ncbi:unnamed protein product, partial [Polarella glacialis]